MGRWVASLVLLLAFAGSAQASVIRGSPRSDGIVAQDSRKQTVVCGRGRDVVSADPVDLVRRDCETVSRQVSLDSLRGGPGQHATQVEPDSFSFGRTVVSVFQVGRIHAGAAMEIGWATSRDAGRTWRRGRLPGQTIFSSPAGIAQRASDPVVAYDAGHRVWLAATLAVSPGLTQLLISRSPDGIGWSLPVQAAVAASDDLGYDKEWISCDNGAASPFRGRCYLSYTDFEHHSLSTQFSGDGGLTWSDPVAGATDLADRVVGVQPASLPDGALTIVFVGEGRDSGMWSIRSRNGGLSYEPKVSLASLRFAGTRVLRSFPLPSVESVGGDVYAVWSDCRFRASCNGSDLVWSRTADGAVWTPLQRVPLPQNRSYAIPGLGVSADRRLALAYYSLPNGCDALACNLGIAFVTSRDGTAWTRPRRLNPQPIRLSWLATTSAGRMVGDYISTSWTDGRPVAVFVLAAAPRRGTLRESVFAYRG